MLLELKKYLTQQSTASLIEISQRFAITVDVARELLTVWQGKGNVEEVVAANCGSKCAKSKCSPSITQRYRWVSPPCHSRAGGNPVNWGTTSGFPPARE